MLNTYIKKRHSKGFCYAFIDLNITEIFKRTGVWIDRDRFGRLYDYGVYLYIDTSKEDWIYLEGMKFPIKGKLIYIGRGVYDPNNPLESRCLNHEGDELSKHLNENICAFLMGWGMTYDESAALEAFWIKTCGLQLLKRGENWTGVGLINKKRERRSEEKAKQILKIWK